MCRHTYNIRNRKINNITAKYSRLNALKYTFESHTEDKDICVIDRETFITKDEKYKREKKFI